MHVTLEDTKRASVLLIRKLFLLMQNLDVLPSNVYLTMKLYYYDDSKCLTGTGTRHKFTSNSWLAEWKHLHLLSPQSPPLTTNRRASRRANVTVSGSKAWLCTSRWVRCRQPSTPWRCVCRQNKAGWRSFKKGTTWGRPSRFPQRGKSSRWVQEED